jgi:hypothetical protein
VSSIQGWIEGDPATIRDIVLGSGTINLADLDSRLEGAALIPSYRSGTTRFELRGNGPAMVEGRPLEVGERVRVTTGGEILWNR